MDDSQLPDNTETLQELYDETIEHHNEYLEKLEKAFEKRCDEIRAQAQTEINKINEGDQEAYMIIQKKEQAELDKTLQELQFAINQSSKNSYAKLEQITDKIESEESVLEKELETV